MPGAPDACARVSRPAGSGQDTTPTDDPDAGARRRAAMLTLVGAAFVAGLVLTGAALLLARRFGVMAIPNARSAHSVPVASIGGLGFVIPTLAWLAWSAVAGGDPLALVLAGGAAVLAVVGLLDDLFDLPAGLRLPIHLVVAAATVAVAVDGNPVVLAICALGLAWFVNLYNFMDGIDGVAGSQAAIFCLGALYFGTGGSFDAACWVLLASTAGFLCLNWAPARVIMGDTGSGFLGFVIGAVVGNDRYEVSKDDPCGGLTSISSLMRTFFELTRSNGRSTVTTLPMESVLTNALRTAPEARFLSWISIRSPSASQSVAMACR